MTRTFGYLAARGRTAAVALVAAGLAAVALANDRPATGQAPPVVVRSGEGGLAPAFGFDLAPAVGAPAAQRSRYRTLLKQIPAPDDRGSYGDFYDYGRWSGTSYLGHDNLPPAYWVYLAPNWYLFQEDANAPAKPLAWAPAQALGRPDTHEAGDIQTAWASATPDGQREWLELTYDQAVSPIAVLVYETYNPGAVDRVTAFDADGREHEVWSGNDPTDVGAGKGVSVIPVKPAFKTAKVRVYLDSPRVPGWNEIDAVGLLDAAGATHWASGAAASTTYADVSASGPVVELRGQ